MFYFASDTHLGAGSLEQQRQTERLFVEWLDAVAQDATAIFLCGDIFDFWFEYRYVVPKGAVRALGKITELTDRGIRVVFMAGNHDMWIREYLCEECGMELYTVPTTFHLGGKKVHVAHGDNLNVKGDVKLKMMNGFFRSRVARVLFSALVHPDLALWFGRAWSRSSRKKHSAESRDLQLRCVEYLKEYAAKHYAENQDDIYIFGHIHYAVEFTEERPQIIFMNDWSSRPHYARLDDAGRMELLEVKSK